MFVSSFGYLFIALMLAANIWASFASVRSTRFSTTNRFVLVSLVWLVPVIGAFAVWIIFSETDERDDINV